MTKYTGSCHCQAVKFEVEANLENGVVECNCSHCAIKSLLLTFVPASQFTLLAGEENLAEYRFNKKVIEHLFCKTCGVEAFARGVDPQGASVVTANVRTLDGVEIAGLNRIPFNGKDV